MKLSSRLVTLTTIFRAALPLVLAAQAGYQPAPENLKARQWFQEARFGLFIHWGVYSVLGEGEWVMNNDKMTVAEYEKLPRAASIPPNSTPPNGWRWRKPPG